MSDIVEEMAKRRNDLLVGARLASAGLTGIPSEISLDSLNETLREVREKTGLVPVKYEMSAYSWGQLIRYFRELYPPIIKDEEVHPPEPEKSLSGIPVYVIEGVPDNHIKVIYQDEFDIKRKHIRDEYRFSGRRTTS